MRALIPSLVVCSLMIVSCVSSDGGDGGGGGGATCTRAANKLRGCDLLTAGELPGCDEPKNDGERCESTCLLNASCADLGEALCSDTLSTALENCLNACDSDEFTCGSGETISASWECDGEEDCTDGSDEAGCPAPEMFTCGDGTEIFLEWKCDGEDDCDDGSDEVGCPQQGELLCN